MATDFPKMDYKAQDEVIPDNISIPDLALQVVRGKIKLSQQQLRVLIELLPYHSPKLSAVAHGYFAGEDFAARLERAVNRSEAKRIEAKVIVTAQDQ